MDIETLSTAIDAYAGKTNAGLETLNGTVGELRERLDRIELAEGRKGLFGSGDETRFEASGWVDSEGKPVPILGKSDYADRRKMAAKLGVRSDAEFSVGDYVKGVAGLKSKPEVRAALQEGVSPAGGYLVPDALMPNIIAALAPSSATLQAGARIVPIDQQAGSFRIARVDTLPTAQWRGESGAVPESPPAFGAITFYPKSLAFYFKVSMELLADAPNIDPILTAIIGQAFAVGMDKAALIGTGAGAEPIGVLNASGTNTVSMGTDGAVPSNWDPILDALYEIELDNAPPATSIIAHPRSWRTLRKLKSSADDQPLIAPPEVAALGRYSSTQLPIDEVKGGSSDCSTVLVGDFSRLMFGMRSGLQILKADQLHAGTGEVGFYCFARMDTALEYAAAICKITGVRA